MSAWDRILWDAWQLWQDGTMAMVGVLLVIWLTLVLAAVMAVQR